MATLKTEYQLVVVDKSFIQGNSRQALDEIAKKYIFVVTSGFYYEVFTNLSESIKKVCKKLPEFRRIDTPKIYQLEKESGKPVQYLTATALKINPKIITGEQRLSNIEEEAINKYNRRLVNSEIKFWEDVLGQGVIGFDKCEIDSIIGNLPKFESLCSRILRVQFVRKIATQLGIPNCDRLDEKWFTFRKLQAMLLHGLTLRYSYPHQNSTRTRRNLEHDIHDLDYLALGTHNQCFATNESKSDFRKLGWKYKFLCPQGQLMQSRHVHGVSQIEIL